MMALVNAKYGLDKLTDPHRTVVAIAAKLTDAQHIRAIPVTALRLLDFASARSCLKSSKGLRFCVENSQAKKNPIKQRDQRVR
mmetsp:Transcript_13515/g.19488  ORF Transcript_13515/g.19488 Transcript_13515/m.19488 type:complete len:83 (+) Transcript_13515:1410-1658(+)